MIQVLRESLRAPDRHRILFLNDLGFQYGAGIAQARQVQSVLEAGWEAGVLAWEPGGIGLEQMVTRPIEDELWLGLQSVRHLEHEASLSDDDIIAGLLFEVSRFAPSCVIVGNLHCPKWPLQLLTSLSKMGVRVIAYLHDGYLFTGRCPYPGSCNLYLTGCNETCPTADEYPPLRPDLISAQWSLRRQIFNGPSGIEVVTNSHWTRDMFRSALPAGRSCETVYLGADENIFKPGGKADARQELGLPADARIVLCAAVNFHERRKGASYLQAIIKALEGTAIFAAFGHNTSEIPGLIGLGYHTNPSTLAQIYRAADVFLGTATEEAFGQTILEAQLTGLPVVAFQAGGLPEIVRGEITGKLVPVGNVPAAVAAIQSLLADPYLLTQSGVWSRQAAQNRYSLHAQAKGWNDYLAGNIPRALGFNPPTESYPRRVSDAASRFQPSWAYATPYLSVAHEKIIEQTADLAGAATPTEALKLYEMGFYAGDIILEIGVTGGRCATAALRGGLANPARTLPPQYYGVTHSMESIACTRQSLADQNLVDYAHLFEGSLSAFATQWSITPTMVYLGGERVPAQIVEDLAILARYLKPDTAVLIHDFINADTGFAENEAMVAIHEWESAGHARFMGHFGSAALYLIQAATLGSTGGLQEKRQ